VVNEPFKHPPLVSAACEFRFMPTDTWDMTVPGAVWERLRERYPERRQDIRVETEMAQRPDGLEQRVTQTEWLTMYRSSEDATVQVTRDRLLVTRGKPYPNWPIFRDEIAYALQSYDSTLSPNGLARMGLRYINNMDIPEETIDLEDYLEFYPASGKGLPDTFMNFMVAAEYPFDDGEAVLRLRLAPSPSPNDKTTSFVLDIDYFTAQPPEYGLVQCRNWLEKAHARVEEAFLAAIRPSLKRLFEEESKPWQE
jgi:uncharacterized protein (TIGR04255 family)